MHQEALARARNGVNMPKIMLCFSAVRKARGVPASPVQASAERMAWIVQSGISKAIGLRRKIPARTLFLYMIHPVSIACAKPDLRFQRSMPVAAKGVSRPLLLPVCRGSRHWVVSTTSYLFVYSRQTGEEHSLASDRSRCWDWKRYTNS